MAAQADRAGRATAGVLMLGALSLTAAACRAPRPVERPYPPPTLAAIEQGLRARAAELRTLRAEAKVDYLARGADGQRVKVRVLVLLGRSGRLRLEAESPLGGALATLASNGERFGLLDVPKNRYYVGAPSSCAVALLLGLELPPGDAMDLLSGGSPLPGEGATLSWDARAGRERIEVPQADGGTLRVWLDANRPRPDAVEVERIDARGQVLWRVRHEAFEEHGGFRLPVRTRIERPADGADAILRYRRLEPNADLPEQAFALEPPEGLAPQQILCD